MQKFRQSHDRKNRALIHMIAFIFLLSCTIILLAQTVFAEIPYVTTDGDYARAHTTDTASPSAGADETGLELDYNDMDTVQENADRHVQTVEVFHNGKSITIQTHGETVEALLSRLNVVIDENTRVSEPLNSNTYDGLQLTVGHTTRKVETYTVPVPYETVYQNDPTLESGIQTVKVPGSTGQLQRLASVLYENGSEVSRTILNEELIEEPVNEVICVGTAAAEPENSSAPVFGQTPIIEDGKIITASGEVLFYRDVIKVRASAYTKTDEGCNDFTSTGSYARVGAIAVDPTVIPYGTRMFIISDDGVYVYGIATAEDCGGAIQGDRVDLYFDTTYECFQFGRRTCSAYILG